VQGAGGRINALFGATASDSLADQCGIADVKAHHGKKGECFYGKRYVGSSQLQITEPAQHLNKKSEPKDLKEKL